MATSWFAHLETKPKRTYVRTKVVREKPIDLTKLKLPFDYGWRRETRIRGVGKNGRLIGEVFYFTTTDKRMRSFNEVQRYLDGLKKRHEEATTNGSLEKDVTASSDATPGGEEKSSSLPEEEKSGWSRCFVPWRCVCSSCSVMALLQVRTTERRNGRRSTASSIQ